MKLLLITHNRNVCVFVINTYVPPITLHHLSNDILLLNKHVIDKFIGNCLVVGSNLNCHLSPIPCNLADKNSTCWCLPTGYVYCIISNVFDHYTINDKHDIFNWKCSQFSIKEKSNNMNSSILSFPLQANIVKFAWFTRFCSYTESIQRKT